MNIDFRTFREDVEAIAKKIQSEAEKPDIILAIARGGWIPARLLSDFLKVKQIASVGLGYTDETRQNLEFYSLPDLRDSHRHILLVEDILESGRSLEYAKTYFIKAGKTVTTASIYLGPDHIYTPDFFLRKLREIPRFFWE